MRRNTNSSTEEGYFTIRRSNRFCNGISSDQAIQLFLMRLLKTSGGMTPIRGITDSTLARWVHSLPGVCLSAIHWSLSRQFIGTMGPFTAWCVPICNALESFTSVHWHDGFIHCLVCAYPQYTGVFHVSSLARWVHSLPGVCLSAIHWSLSRQFIGTMASFTAWCVPICNALESFTSVHWHDGFIHCLVCDYLQRTGVFHVSSLARWVHSLPGVCLSATHWSLSRQFIGTMGPFTAWCVPICNALESFTSVHWHDGFIHCLVCAYLQCTGVFHVSSLALWVHSLPGVCLSAMHWSLSRQFIGTMGSFTAWCVPIRNTLESFTSVHWHDGSIHCLVCAYPQYTGVFHVSSLARWVHSLPGVCLSAMHWSLSRQFIGTMGSFTAWCVTICNALESFTSVHWHDGFIHCLVCAYLQRTGVFHVSSLARWVHSLPGVCLSAMHWSLSRQFIGTMGSFTAWCVPICNTLESFTSVHWHDGFIHCLVCAYLQYTGVFHVSSLARWVHSLPGVCLSAMHWSLSRQFIGTMGSFTAWCVPV